MRFPWIVQKDSSEDGFYFVFEIVLLISVAWPQNYSILPTSLLSAGIIVLGHYSVLRTHPSS